MEQHPIPQQITSYEFKLVGEMTLKQFGKAAGGILIAVAINAAPLVFFVKWPLIFLFAIGGLALAFVPFQDRPLETWLLAFLKSIYNPTMFIYKKSRPKNWFDIDLAKNWIEIVAAEKKEQQEMLENKPIKKKSQVDEFIGSLPSVNREKVEEKQITNEKTEETKYVETKNEEIKDEKIDNSEKQTTVEDSWIEGKPGLNLKREKDTATGEIVFGQIPMPNIPDLPNLIVGMVLDNLGKIVTEAIVEIQDVEGNPSRVMRTNSLGQFKTSTQMTNGDYLIVTEKDGLSFDKVKLALDGKIVQPVKITAK
ncbi:MAG: PrgI family protein [Candidatus Shapirobacteria bacterium]